MACRCPLTPHGSHAEHDCCKDRVCNGCDKGFLHDETVYSHRVRTNEEFHYHEKCAIQKALESALDADYDDPYYD